MIVRVHDEVFRFVHMVPFVAVALVDIKIDDHELLQSKPFLHVAGDESDVRVGADTFRSRSIAVAMVKPSPEVDCPTLMVRYVCGLDRTKSLRALGVEYSHSEEPAGEDAEGQACDSAEWQRVVQSKHVPRRDDKLEELSAWKRGLMQLHRQACFLDYPSVYQALPYPLSLVRVKVFVGLLEAEKVHVVSLRVENRHAILNLVRVSILQVCR